MRRLATLLTFASVSLVAGACADKAQPAAQQPAAPRLPADSFRVTFETSRGTFVVAVTRAWAPKGADRLGELVRSGFFDDNRFFRVVPGFVAQFGLNDKPKINEQWDAKRISDEPVLQSNARGTVAFASQGPNSRSHQLFINLADNARLDPLGFAPVGRVIQGMDVVDSIYSGYTDRPDQALIQTLGNSYLKRVFPKLDYVKKARISVAGGERGRL